MLLRWLNRLVVDGESMVALRTASGDMRRGYEEGI